MAATGGDVSFKFTADTSGLTAAVKDVARAQESAASTAATAAATARTALEAQRAATVTVTMAEKELIAKTLALEAATRSKAAALGISVGQLRQVEAATQRAAATSAAAATGIGNLGNAATTSGTKFDKLGAAMGPLGGVLARISPEAGAVASTIAGLTGTFNGVAAAGLSFSPVLVGLAPIFATVGAAAFVYISVMEDYTAAKREATRVTELFAATMLPLNDALGAARAENDLLTQAQSAGIAEFKEYQAISAIQSDVSAKEAAATATLRAELDTLSKAYEANTAKRSQDGQIQGNRIGKIREELAVAGDAARELNKLGVANMELRNALEKRADGEGKAAKATAQGAKGAKDHADALRVLTDEMERQAAISEKAEKAFAGTLSALSAQEKSAKAAVASKAEAIELDYEGGIVAAAAALADAESHDLTTSAKETIDEQYRQTVSALDVKYYADLDALRKADEAANATLADAKKANARQLRDEIIGYAVGVAQSAGDILNAIGGVFDRMASASAEAYDQASGRAENLRDLIDGLSTATVDAADLSGDALVAAYRRGEVATEDLSDAQRKAIDSELTAREESAEARAKVEKKSAKEAFETSKAVAIAQAVVAGATAIVQSFAQLGPIGGAIAAVGIVATTAAEIALIDSTKPAFHAGGMYPDEGNARLLGGEPVINRQAAARLGLDTPGAVADVNQGGAGGPSMGGVTVLRIGRLEAREIVRSDIAAGGLIVRTARAAARSAGNPAGRTGRRPIA